MKKFFSFLVFAIILYSSNLPAQTKNQGQDVITTTMAKKISYSCKHNRNMLSLFANANNIAFHSEADKILVSLDKHLDYARKFVIVLYSSYGIEQSYFTLKDAGFTIPEIDRAEAIWAKEENRRDIVIQKQKKEKEQSLLKRIEANELFAEKELSIKSEIEIDLNNLISYPAFEYKAEECIDFYYRFILDKEGKLSLLNPSDTLSYSTTEKFIYDYLTKYDIGGNTYSPAYITIDNKDIPVISYANIIFKEYRIEKNEITVLAKKDKKINRWTYDTDFNTKLNRATSEPEVLLLDLENILCGCSELNKKRVYLKIQPYKRILNSNVGEDEQMSYYFDISYLKGIGGFSNYVPVDCH